MRTSPKILFSLAACAAMTACGSIPKKTFVFDAITFDERSHPCLIVIDDEWDKAIANNQVVNLNNEDNELEITIEFRRPSVEVTVAPLSPGSNEMPKSRSEAIKMSPQFNDAMPRRLRMDDPAKHLFVLPPKRR